LSEFTLCNYCSMEILKRRAKREDKKVVMRAKALSRSFPKGVDIHLVPKGKEATKQNWVAWFAELTNHCVC